MTNEQNDLTALCAQVAQTCAASHLRRTSRVVSQLFDEKMRSTGLRGTQFTLLVATCLAGPVSVTILADRIVMDRTTLSRNLKPLISKGLIDLTTGADRRKRVIELTVEGERMVRQGLPLWQQAQVQMVDGLGQGRFETLLEG